MASSVVISAGVALATFNTEVGNAIGSGTSNPQPSPAGVAVGDLLVGVVALDSSIVTVSASTGWTTLLNSVLNGVGIYTFGRIADGTATDTLSVGSGTAATDYCATVLRITGHTVTSGTLTTAIKTAQASGTSINPNPSAITGQPSATRLWLAICAVDRTATLETITAIPTNYTSVTNLVSSAETSSTTLAVTQRTLTGTGEDPGTFTASASRPYTSVTLAIP